MVKLKMSQFEMRDMYVFNCERREILLKEALKQNDKEAQFKFVVDYFLNKLDPAVVSKIDGIEVREILPFKYDYSFLEDYGSFDVRRKFDRRWGNGHYGFSMSQVDNDCRSSEKIRVYPAVYALKMGTCVMFASELQRFARDFDLESQIVEKMEFCYDNFNGSSIESKQINTDRLIRMQHFYNIVTINGKKYKIDIAGYLTAEDFNKNHPELRVDENEFYFSEKTQGSPFAKLAKLASHGVLDLSEQKQPQ